MIKKEPPYCCFLLLSACLLFSDCRREPATTMVSPYMGKILDEANKMYQAGQKSKAVAYLDSAFRQYPEPTAAEKLIKYTFDHNFFAEDQQDDSIANNYADSAITLFKDQDFREKHFDEYKQWLFNKGDALISLKKFQEAFRYYHLGKLIIEKVGDTCSMARFSVRLGRVRYKQLNYQDAIRYFRQAFREYNLCRADSANYSLAVKEPQGVLNSTAWFYEQLHKNDSALVYYHKALAFLEQQCKKFPANKKETAIATAVTNGNLGGLFNTLDSNDLAESLLKQSIAVNSQPGYNQRDVQSAQIKMAALYVKTGNLDEAASWLENAREGIDTLPGIEYSKRWTHVKWQYFDRAGDLKQAYQWLQRYNYLTDSLNQINQDLMAADFVREFENIDHAFSMNQLKTKNRQNFTLLIVSVLALILVSCIVYLIYRNWRLSKWNVDRLKVLNDEINQKNEKLQLALLALQDSQQDNTRLMAMVAHDLRTPAANIQMSTNLLLKNNRIPEQDQRFLEIIRKSAMHSLEMIDEVMHTNKVSPADGNDCIDLEIMISDCVELMQLRANEKDQEIIVTTVPVIFKGSREKLWRVVSNLIFNAIKFTPRRGKILVTLIKQEEEAIIIVQDNGIGIPAENRDLLAAADAVPGRQGTEGEASNGMGLHIVKQIVLSYQGKIHFESPPGKGTTFFVHLPV